MPSLLDRLKDDAPGRQTEAHGEAHGDGYGSSLASATVSNGRMRELVRDSLVSLFNTTNIEDRLDPRRHREVLQSVVNYGLPPLTGGFSCDLRWEAVERMVRQAIVRFEPRIIPSSLQILPPEDEEKSPGAQAGHTLQFSIQAMIYMDPHPVEFSLQGNMDLENHAFVAHLVKN